MRAELVVVGCLGFLAGTSVTLLAWVVWALRNVSRLGPATSPAPAVDTPPAKQKPSQTEDGKVRTLPWRQVPELAQWDDVVINREKGTVRLMRFDGNNRVREMPLSTYEMIVQEASASQAVSL